MKKITLLVSTIALLQSVVIYAQPAQRCVTSEKMQELFRTDPQARIRYETTKRLLDEKVRLYLSDPNAALFRTNSTINIPVAVHIMISNPAMVTDATVQSQIDTLNYYYGGAPAGDSLRVYTPFRAAYGRTQIRFCIAQRTPAGLATNGIERTTTSQTYTTSTAHPSNIVPAWNTQNYLNIWVVQFTDGTLGYSYLPGSFPPGDQRAGFVVDYRAFGAGASYLYSTYNKGRTAVHEIGHFFNLQHPWGNGGSNPTCSADDGCSDTPPTSGPFYGCPSSFPVTNTCTSTAPGIMWQNHMDYADDRCMNLFTQQQATRMETALNNAPDRMSLLTSNGCQPVATSPNDAGITLINTPLNGNVYCSPNVTPQVTLKNFGTSTLTSVSINLTLNGGTPAGYPFNWTGSLASGSSISVVLPAISLASGTNTIVVSTSNPNGAADGGASNDASTSIVSLPGSVALPFTEGFENASFPPNGWTLFNPDGSTTWVRFTAGTAATGAGMAGINYFNYGTTDQVDELVTPPLDAASAGSGNKLLSFARSYRQYGADPADMDTLEILVSADCGASYTSVWKKWGPTLATVTPSTTSSFAPSSTSMWVTETIDITPYATSGMRVKFRGINRFGNNLFLDNINIQKQANRDIKMLSVNVPGATSCSNQITPQVTVINNGLETITSFNLGYHIDNGANVIQTINFTLAPGASQSFTLGASITVPGNHSFVAFTSDPSSGSGSGDSQMSNDTLSRGFTVVPVANPPVVEGFETSFPPQGWTLNNPDNNTTWIKKAPGRNSHFSAFMENFNQSLNDQRDELKTPYINVAGADSLVMTFDLAHKNYPDISKNDTLSVLVSTDCGNTYSVVYKKWSSDLATSGSSASGFTAPGSADWRNERIALNNAFTTNGSVSVIIRNTNRSGNNVFVDNVNINPVFRRDMRVLSVNQPSSIICSGNINPSVTVQNAGMETVTSFKVSYTMDNGAVQSTTVNGVNLARGNTTSVNLPNINIQGTGAHIMRVYTLDPVTVSGTGDQYIYNDTLVKNFAIAGTVSAPLTESFESGTFPPANWSVANPDNSITWKRYASGNGNAGSAFLNSFAYSSEGEKDDLASPNVTYSGVDSVKLTFDLAATTHTGSTITDLDTLEVLVTKDCGNSFTTVYKKWGEDLQTVNDPQPVEFYPLDPSQWRKETVDLTGFGGTGPIMIFFRTTNNFVNNIFIDNVNLTTRILPDRIKQQGYLVLPTPFQNSFGVWHVEQPSTLKNISVYNSLGQLIWTKNFSGDAQKVEAVNLTGKAAGVYIVRLSYDDEHKNVSERVLKY